jgi:nickel/cobalt transporter (NicO) family protein
MFQIPLFSTYVLGALHSLEPGHGKSILALHTSQSKKWSEGISLLATLLITHFLLVVVVSFILFSHPEWLDIAQIQFIAPVLVIFYGLFLLVKSQKNKEHYLACSCSHDSHDTTKNPYFMGILAGLTPCPSVFAPVVICLSHRQFDQIFYFLLAYIAGVVSVFLVLFLSILYLKNATTSKWEKVLKNINPHLLSGGLMVLVGISYLAFGLLNSHA